MAIYRNELIPPSEFVRKLKLVSQDLYPVYDSLSMRWDILYRSPKNGEIFNVMKVCERDHEGIDIGYRKLDDRTIDTLLRMDTSRRNLSGKQVVQELNDAEDYYDQVQDKKIDDLNEAIVKENRPLLKWLRDNIRGVHYKMPALASNKG